MTGLSNSSYNNEKDNLNSRVGKSFSNICLSMGNYCDTILSTIKDYSSKQRKPGVTIEQKNQIETEKNKFLEEKLTKLTAKMTESLERKNSTAAKEFLKNLVEFKDKISEITNSKGTEFTKFIQEKYKYYSEEFQEKFSTENNQPIAFG